MSISVGHMCVYSAQKKKYFFWRFIDEIFIWVFWCKTLVVIRNRTNLISIPWTMDEDPADGFDTEENHYAFLNVPKTVSFFIGAAWVKILNIHTNATNTSIRTRTLSIILNNRCIFLSLAISNEFSSDFCWTYNLIAADYRLCVFPVRFWRNFFSLSFPLWSFLQHIA